MNTDTPQVRTRTRKPDEAQADTAEDTGKIFARLVRGRIYILGDKTFEAMQSVEVTAEEQAHLEDCAVDFIDIKDSDLPNGFGSEPRQKFEFASTPFPAVDPVVATARRLAG